jgi:NADP-dependent 3-hydroxy acid dehydrogenase YdfG
VSRTLSDWVVVITGASSGSGRATALAFADAGAAVVLAARRQPPLSQAAANFAGRLIKPLRPLLRPERVAAAIVRCAKRPRREAVVGSPAVSSSCCMTWRCRSSSAS